MIMGYHNMSMTNGSVEQSKASQHYWNYKH